MGEGHLRLVREGADLSVADNDVSNDLNKLQHKSVYSAPKLIKESSAMVAVFRLILIYVPLCIAVAVQAQANTMSTEEAEAYLAELHRKAMLQKQRAEQTKVLGWSSELLKDGKVSKITK
jgi:hypothetical protein